MDHAISVESATLGLMVLTVLLSVFAGWLKTSERIARLEVRVESLIENLSPKRRSHDRDKSDVDEE